MPKKLEDRLARLELEMKGLHGALELQTKRMIALQAQLDHLQARVSSRGTN